MWLAKAENGKNILIKPPVLPYATVNLIILKKTKDYILTKVHSLIDHDPSWSNATVPCSHYQNPLDKQDEKSSTSPIETSISFCGGCKRQVIEYTKQLQLKQDILAETCASMPQLLPNILPIIPSPQQFHYRNKVERSFGTDKHGNKSLGFHQAESFQHIVAIDQCHLVSPQAHKIFSYCKKIFEQADLPYYNPIKHTWVLRHFCLREGVNTGQILINLIIASNNISTTNKSQRKSLLSALSSDQFLQQHLTTRIVTENNNLSDSVPHDAPYTTLRWPWHIFEKLIIWPHPTSSEYSSNLTLSLNTSELSEYSVIWSDLTTTFKISPFSFFQTNTEATQLLVTTLAQYIPHNQHSILDLYCGTGSLGLSLLKMGKAKHIIGIEINDQAINDARLNAKINNLQDKVYFSTWKAEVLKYSDKYIQKNLDSIDTIILDPPRTWLHPDTIKFLIAIRQQKAYTLVYISCNPSTRIRDMQVLIQKGNFTCSMIQALDMFPQSYHFETIAVLH